MEKYYDKINNEIIWCYSRPSIRNQKNFTRLHDTIFWFLKDKNEVTFNSDSVRIDYSDSTKERNKYQAGGSKYAGGTNERQTHEDGKIPEDYWDIDLDDWYIPLPPGNDLQFMYFETQKPESLLERVIKASSNREDLILDYFLGSATTLSVAHKLERKWIGVEHGDYFWTKIIPRMKRVLIGDVSGISEDNDWSGGGFFKYYELEQYEEALARSEYQEQDDYDISKYTFGKDQKQLEAIELDYENKKAHIHFEKLYPDVDIAETLSNLTGKRIQKLNAERVKFEDGQEIVFDEMTFGEYPWIKPLIWWNSRRAEQN